MTAMNVALELELVFRNTPGRLSSIEKRSMNKSFTKEVIARDDIFTQHLQGVPC
jgi:hypothetical protein